MASKVLTTEELTKAYSVVKSSNLCIRTPLLPDVARWLPDDKNGAHLFLKLENMQKTGSFKIRGVVNQLENLTDDAKEGKRRLVTMSAGNYGKAFAIGLHTIGLNGMVLMPLNAPKVRRTIIESYGMTVETMETNELQPCVDKYVKEDNMMYLHSYDDANLIAGHASLGYEIMEDCDPDVVVVCCGGGGVLAGVACAIRMAGNTKCRIYGVEATEAPTMHQSFETGRPSSLDKKPTTIAAGLAPPYAGQMTYDICKEYVDEILLVTDDEIRKAMKTLYHMGLVVEPSGCAAFAAYRCGKIPDISDKCVVVVLTGGNVTPHEVDTLLSMH